MITTGPANPSTVGTATFTFTGTDNVTASAGLIFECRLDSQNEADFVECTNPYGYPNLDLPAELEPGPHMFDVRAVDQEDNVDLTPASYAWTVTGTPTAPQTTIATAPDIITTSYDGDVHLQLEPAGLDLRVLAGRGGVRAVHLAPYGRQPGGR